MSTAPVKSLIDEQLEEIERKLQILDYVAIPEELAPRDFPVQCLPRQLAPTMKEGRVAVRARP